MEIGKANVVLSNGTIAFYCILLSLAVSAFLVKYSWLFCYLYQVSWLFVKYCLSSFPGFLVIYVIVIPVVEQQPNTLVVCVTINPIFIQNEKLNIIQYRQT